MFPPWPYTTYILYAHGMIAYLGLKCL